MLNWSQIRQLLADGKDGLAKHKELVEVNTSDLVSFIFENIDIVFEAKDYFKCFFEFSIYSSHSFSSINTWHNDSRTAWHGMLASVRQWPVTLQTHVTTLCFTNYFIVSFSCPPLACLWNLSNLVPCDYWIKRESWRCGALSSHCIYVCVIV